jgi:hypothetical protein
MALITRASNGDPPRRRKRRGVVIGVVAAGFLGLGGVSFAYWTLTGSGSGSGGVAAGTGTVTLGASFADGIYPGGTRTVTFTASNPNTHAVRIGTVSLASVTTTAPGCDVADFTMGPVLQGFDVAANATDVTLPNTGTLAFANTAVNQDDCKGATITINITSD